MRWKLFLDDERYPTTNDWVIARNFNDAVWYVKNYGLPYFISFDHDLGNPANQTGLEFAKWFIHYLLYYEYHSGGNKPELPDDFDWFVHSQNPIGAENIRSYMKQGMKEFYETQML